MRIFKGSLRTASGTVLALLAMNCMSMSLNFAGMKLLSVLTFACYALLAVGLLINFRGIAAAGAVCGLIARVLEAGGISSVFAVFAHFRATLGNFALLAQLAAFILMICCFLVPRNMILPVLTALVCLAGFLVLPGMNGAFVQYFGSGTLISAFFYKVVAIPLTFVTLSFALGS